VIGVGFSGLSIAGHFCSKDFAYVPNRMRQCSVVMHTVWRTHNMFGK
jgi:hypothetical protein